MASNSTVNREAMLAARHRLVPVKTGWLGGFGNMLSKELGQWWATSQWWIQTLIWVLIINGITTIVLLTETAPPAELMVIVIQTYFPLSAMVVAIGTIATVQGAIIGEKEMGTASWVLSKPASRAAFILAKTLGNIVGFWITAIMIPTVIFVIVTGQFFSISLPMRPFLAGVALMALSQLFYLALALMLGTLFNSRGGIVGIGIAVILSGQFLKGMLPAEVLMLTPWLLPDTAVALALGSSLPPNWYVPILAVSVWIILMMAVALWRFEWEEFR